MNVKSEKIEQFIQIINRNLLLVQAGQENSVTPLEFRNLQKIDANVFGTDKFAFEMVHFVKSGCDNTPPEGSLLYKWEKSFLRGLETLLVECGVVKDEIERDCLIGRVYCWFSEKLSDRRELPRPAVDIEGLKSTVQSIVPQDANSSTIKALETFGAKITDQNVPVVAPAPVAPLRSKTVDDTKPSPRMAAVAKEAMAQRGNLLLVPDSKKPNSTITNLPVIPQVLQPSVQPNQRPRSQPSGTDGGVPFVSKQQQYANQITGLLPKIPGQESNYGMLYHKPESEAEVTMHEMWLARRRQEAFDWKAQQQVTLLMDRIGLHKSRVESEALRKQESGSYLGDAMASAASTHTDSHSNGHTLHGTNSVSKFVPIITGDRPLSAKRHNAMAAREMAEHGLSSPGATKPMSPNTRAQQRFGRMDSPMSDVGSPGPLESPTTRALPRGKGVKDGAGDTMLSVTGGSIGKEDTTVAKASRGMITKTVHRSYIPMRFKSDGFAAKVHSYDRQHYYMQGSDSEDEEETKDRHGRTAGGHRGSTAGGHSTGQQTVSASGTVAGGATTNSVTSSTVNVPAPVVKDVAPRRRGHQPVYKERPKSSTKFKEVSFNDPEAKVHYRHSNYRRMPLTHEQHVWLAAQEDDRRTRIEEKARLAAEAAAAKKKKKDEKGKKKDKGKDGKKKKEAKKEPEKPAAVEVKKSKYKSPAHFMAKNFPMFDMGESVKWAPKPKSTAASVDPSMNATGATVSSVGGNSVASSQQKQPYNVYNMTDITDDNFGPMRTMQMIECNRILDVCDEWAVPMDPKVLHRALVIPQDKPYAVTIEQGVHNPTGGLMQNPMPKEYWKTIPGDLVAGGGKKKGGKKKKK